MSTPSAGRSRSAAVGPQPRPAGTGPVPIAHSAYGSVDEPLTCQAAGVSMKSPWPSPWRTHPGGGGGGDGLTLADEVCVGEASGELCGAGPPGAGRPLPPSSATLVGTAAT